MYPTPPRTPRKSYAVARTGLRHIAQRVAAQAAITGLNAFSPNAATALRLARRAHKAYRVYKQASRTTTTTRKRGRGFTGESTGVYAGKFGKRKKQLGGTAKIMEKYANLGMVKTTEVRGDVNDADCVYIGHSTYALDDISTMMAQALVRKILKKAGIDSDGPSTELPFYAFNDSDGFKLELIRHTASGGQSTISFESGQDATIKSMAGNFAAEFKESLKMEGAADRTNYTQFLLYLSDRNGVATNWRLAAQINLRTEKMHICVASELNVQNRTKAATAGTGDVETDRVDNQPLKGVGYYFYGGVPNPKTYGNISTGLSGLNSLSFDGVYLQQSADLVPANQYKEPPHPKIFSNLAKSQYVNLDPGSLKKSTIKSYWSGFFNPLLNKLRCNSRIANIVFAPGKCEIFGLEERINSGSANLITCAYEVDRKTGVYFTSTKNKTTLYDYEEIPKSNLG